MNTLTSMTAIAREAGQYMRGSSETDSTDKTNTKDFVTVADIKSQAILRDRLLENEPEAVVLSEEDSEEMRAAMYEPDFTGYVLDPIDGTYNFKRDMKESSISIGFIEDGTPVRGVIYDPYKDEMYTVEKGMGAFRNGNAIHVSSQNDIVGASVATSNSYDDEAMARNLRRHLSIYEKTGHMPWTNCPGSGVLIMANIACGRFDVYHHNGLKPWDNAAAFLLVSEAGGEVCTLDGSPARFIDNAVIIGNSAMVSLLRETFTTIDPILLT
ncbi:MAG: inositol monophosphatase [Candidatus Saccharibacteria bacterium]|nr:inositol monophosphatase [Candidatus Saccharibacteria bacterium]